MIFLPLVAALEVAFPKVKIMQLTDLHFGEGSLQDKMSIKHMENLLEWEKPDCVVITGDMVSGYAWPGEKGWYEKLYSKYVSAFVKFGVPWALTLGNHDTEADLEGRQIMELDSKHNLSLSRESFSFLSHSSNYFVPINYKGELRFVLWLLDSGNRNHCDGLYGYDCVHKDQIEWLSSVQDTLKAARGSVPQGLVFMHIPPPEFMLTWNSRTSKGSKYENVACWANHSNYFVESLQSILGVVAGHDHFNDYEGKYLGVKLYYGRKTGYGGYGPRPYMTQGARIFEVNLTNYFVESWIREENGNVLVQEKMQGDLFLQTVCAESQEPPTFWVALVGILASIALILGCFFAKKRVASHKTSRLII